MTEPLEAVARALNARRAEELGGCNAPSEITHCDDSTGCWCWDRSRGDARAAIEALIAMPIIPDEVRTWLKGLLS